MFVEKVGVVGAGTMGAAIAEVMALNGKQVILKDVESEYVKAGLGHIEKSLEGLVEFHESKADNEIERIEDLGVTLTDEQKDTVREAKKPTFTRDRIEQVRQRVTGQTEYDGFDELDLVIEAVPERMDLKKQVFAELEANTERHTVLATNTSALSVTEIASGTEDRRQKVVGLHFFNPPQTLPLVEVVPGLETHRSVVEESIRFLEELRNHRYPLQPIEVKETPGFVVNRILGRMFTEAFLIYEEGVASKGDIDRAMKTGAGMPMGPLELADMVGIDVVYHVAENMKAMGGAGPQREPQIIRKLYNSGRLGKKTGRGFYDYTGDEY